MTTEDLRVKITGGKTKDEMKSFIEFTMSSKQFGRSLALVQRSDIVRASVYLLWSQVFKINDRRVSMRSLIEKLDNMNHRECDVPAEYEKWFNLEKNKRSYVSKRKRSRLRPRQYNPIIKVSVTRDEVVQVLKKDWYGMDVEETEEFDIVRQNVYDIDWIHKDQDKTFEFLTPNQFLVLLNGIPNKFNKVRLLARGASHSGDTIESLMRDNCCAGMTMIMNTEDMTSKYLNDVKVINSVSHRLHGWSDILFQGSSHELLTRCFDDVTRHSGRIQMNDPILGGTYEDNKISLLLVMMKEGIIDLMRFFNLQGKRDMWIKSQKLDDDGNTIGDGILMKNWKTKPLLIHYLGSDIVKIQCNDIEIAREFSEIVGCNDYNDEFISLKFVPSSLVSRYGGIYLTDGNLESPRIVGMPRSESVDLFEINDVLDEYLSANTKMFDYMNLIEDNEISTSILYAVAQYCKKSKPRFINPSTAPNRPIEYRSYSRERRRGNLIMNLDELEKTMNDLFDLDIEPEYDGFDEMMGFGDNMEIVDYTISGTETMKLRKRMAWERNEATREMVSTLEAIGKQMRTRNRNRFMYQDWIIELYEKTNRIASFNDNFI